MDVIYPTDSSDLVKKIIDTVYEKTGRQLLFTITTFNPDDFTPQRGVSFLTKENRIVNVPYKWNPEVVQDLAQETEDNLQKEIIEHSVKAILVYEKYNVGSNS